MTQQLTLNSDKNTPKSLFRIIKSLWVLFGLMFIAWMFYSMQAKEVDERLLSERYALTIEQKHDYYLLTPQNGYSEVLVFFPGAMVQAKAYLPLLSEIAAQGVQVWLIRMPFRMATFGYKKPIELGLLRDSNKIYTLAGHSQGAKMAAQFALEYPTYIDRLILIATTHPRDFSLHDISIPVLKVYGSRDGVASMQDILQNASLLPETTEYINIEGGNHSQFGHYGPQLGDYNATISREVQQSQTADAVIRFILSGRSSQK